MQQARGIISGKEKITTLRISDGGDIGGGGGSGGSSITYVIAHLGTLEFFFFIAAVVFFVVFSIMPALNRPLYTSTEQVIEGAFLMSVPSGILCWLYLLTQGDVGGFLIGIFQWLMNLCYDVITTLLDPLTAIAIVCELAVEFSVGAPVYIPWLVLNIVLIVHNLYVDWNDVDDSPTI
ncbi:MAG: hypothetical protein WED04_10320 [Promethearchaeati archaeon SRVP18_Atabeyarchaeia-1]